MKPAVRAAAKPPAPKPTTLSGVWLILAGHPDWVAWVGLVLALLCILQSLSRADAGTLGIWISSDTLWLVNVFTDLFHDGYTLAGWHFSIAPCWFPDVTAVGLFWALTRNVVVATMLAGIFQAVFMVAAFHVISKTLGVRFVDWQDSMLLLVAVLVALYVAAKPGNVYPALFKYFMTQSHVGSMLAVLWGWALALILIHRRSEDRALPAALVVAYFALCLLSGMSNVLFFPHMLAPLTLALGASVFFGVVNIGKCWLPIGVGWPAAALGAVLNRVLFTVAGVSTESGISYDRSLTALDTFMRGFTAKVLAHDWLHLVALIFVVVCVGYVAWTIRTLVVRGRTNVRSTQIMRAIFLATCLLSVVFSAAVIIVGGSVGLVELKDYVWSMHYLHQIFLFPIFALPMTLWWLMERVLPASKLPVTVWAGALLALLLPAGKFAGTPFPTTPIYAYRPPLVRLLDQTAATTPLHYGLAGYWQARLITLLSKSGLRAYAVVGDLKPFLWVNNEQWYRQSFEDRTKPPKYDFVVLDEPMFKITRQTAVRVFGEPVRELEHDGTRILLYVGAR